MKKIKLSTETKIALVAFVIICVICAIAVCVNFAVYGGVAHAEGDEIVAEGNAEDQGAETPVLVVEKEIEKDDIVTVFKNNILPYVSGAATSFLGCLIMLIPYIKTRGQNKALQGAITVAGKTIDSLKAKEGELTVEKIVEKIQNDLVGTLMEFITTTVKAAIAENVKDTTGDINAIDSKVDVLSAQLTNLIKAATLTWGEIDGVKPLLLNSPTSQTLAGYLAEVKGLKAQVAEQNAEALAPVEALEKELEVYGDEN